MADTLSFLSVIAFIIAGISLAAAVFFWFFFRISSVIGDLSGRNAKRSIEKMRAANAKTGNKTYRESKINLERGKVTDAMSGSDRLKKEKKDSAAVSGSSEGMSAGTQSKPETGILDENMAGETGSEMTELLTEEEKNLGDMQATELLMEEETTVRLTKPVQTPDGYRPGKQIVMLSDIMLIHTDEILE